MISKYRNSSLLELNIFREFIARLHNKYATVILDNINDIFEVKYLEEKKLYLEYEVIKLCEKFDRCVKVLNNCVIRFMQLLKTLTHLSKNSVRDMHSILGGAVYSPKPRP